MKTKPMPPLLEESDVTQHWLQFDAPGLFAPTAEQLAIARHVLKEGWKERAADRNMPRPQDLTGACKFASLFTKIAFGGVVAGAHEHQWNIVAGEKLDLSAQVGLGDVDHDGSFFGGLEHLDSVRSCLPRVLKWITTLDALLSQRKYRTIDVGDEAPLPRRDRSAEFAWTAETQEQFHLRYAALRDGLLRGGLVHDQNLAKFSRAETGVNVWYSSAAVYTQRTLDTLHAYQTFTIKAVGTVHDTVKDQLHLTTDEIVMKVLATVEQHEQELLESA